MQNAKWFTVPVIVALVAGLIIGFAAGSYKSGSSQATTTPDVINGDATSTAEVTVSAADQLAGETVDVTDIKLDKTAWLAVKSYTDGKLGNVIGAHRLAAGTYATDQIELVVPTIASSTYAVVAYYDDGDGAFSSQSDTLIESTVGSPVLATFSTK